MCILFFNDSGYLLEFFEFFQDMFLGKDMQKDTIIHTIHTVALASGGAMTTIKNIHSVSINGVPLNIDGYLDIGLIDTIKDLFVNFIGAFVFSVYGFFLRVGWSSCLHHNFLVVHENCSTKIVHMLC